MVLKLMGFGCSVKSNRLIRDRANVGVIQGCIIIFAEISVEVILEGCKVRQCTVSSGLVFSLSDAIFNHSFKFFNIHFSRDNGHC